MPLQLYNDKKVDFMSAALQRRDEAQFAIANALGTINLLPNIRGNWPLNGYYSGGSYDMSTMGKVLTLNGGIGQGMQGILRYFDFDGVDDYLSRADDADLRFALQFSIGGWFNIGGFNGSITGLIGKDKDGTNNRGYSIIIDASNNIVFRVHATGADAAAYISVTSTVAVALNTWYFIAAYYIESSIMGICVNKTWTTNTTSIPASVYGSNAEFRIGAIDNLAGSYLNGLASMCWAADYGSSAPAIENVYEQTRAIYGI